VRKKQTVYGILLGILCLCLVVFLRAFIRANRPSLTIQAGTVSRIQKKDAPENRNAPATPGRPVGGERSVSPLGDVVRDAIHEDIEPRGELTLAAVNALRDLNSFQKKQDDVVVLNWLYYRKIESELKARLSEKYDFSNPAETDRAMRDAEQLIRTFWQEGDLLNPQNYKTAYEARAILELALQHDAENEELYFELENAIMSYCPVLAAASKDDAKMRHFIDSNLRDLGKWQEAHFDKILCKKSPENVTLQDLCVVYDYIYFAPKIPGDDVLKDVMQPKGKMSQEELRKKFNQRLNEYKEPIEKKKRYMLDWAIKVSKQNKWKYYENGFNVWKKQLETEGFVILHFCIYASPSDWSTSKESLLRFSRRGQGFYGLKERKGLSTPCIEISPTGVIESDDMFKDVDKALQHEQKRLQAQ
jgi:hypothetical protein